MLTSKRIFLCTILCLQRTFHIGISVSCLEIGHMVRPSEKVSVFLRLPDFMKLCLKALGMLFLKMSLIFQQVGKIVLVITGDFYDANQLCLHLTSLAVCYIDPQVISISDNGHTINRDARYVGTSFQTACEAFKKPQISPQYAASSELLLFHFKSARYSSLTALRSLPYPASAQTSVQETRPEYVRRCICRELTPITRSRYK